MGVVRLVSLLMENFRSHRKSFVVFPKTGMMLVRGFNRDTGGSSYAGKSSIGLAIAYVNEAGMPFSAKDQKSWYADGGMVVEEVLETDAGLYTVRRGAQYTVTRPDGSKASGSAAVQAELQKVFGAPTDMLAPLIYKPQGKAGRYLWMEPAHKRDFLARVLGIQQLEELAAESQKKISGLENEYQASRFRLVTAENRVRDLSSRLTLETVDVQLLEERVTAGALQLAAAVDATKTLEGLESSYREKREQVAAEIAVPFRGRLSVVEAERRAIIGAGPELYAALESGEERLAKLVAQDREATAAVATARAVLSSQIGSLQVEVRQEDRLNTERDKILDELEVLKTEACPTCERPGWKNSGARSVELSTRLAQILGTELVGIDLKKALLDEAQRRLTQTIHVRDSRIDIFQQAVANIKQQIDARHKAEKQRQFSLADEADKIQAECARAVSNQLREFDADAAAAGKKLKEARERLFLARTAHADATTNLRVTKQENDRRTQEYEDRKGELAVAEKALEAAREDQAARQQAVSAERDFVAMIRSFLTAIFDEVLVAISDRANAILGAVANTAHVSIRFFTEAVNSKGEARQQITTACTISGFPADLESGNSGGMFSSVDLAVDRALAEIISERSNCRPGWVFLDEAWEGMDAVTKESCMEVLQKQAQDKLILVVDHGSETKELFTSFLDVEFKNGISTVQTKEAPGAAQSV
jgi:DNA repair exonuclease SbcCD ATPase subunit